MLFLVFFSLFGCFFPYFSYLLQLISHSKCNGFATVAFTLRIYVEKAVGRKIRSPLRVIRRLHLQSRCLLDFLLFVDDKVE